MSTNRHASPGRRLTRREALAATAVAGAGVGAALLHGGPARALAAAGAAAAPGCVLTPEQTEGPYWG